ncbi:uncharacterized protein with LGFP repeats [Geodermatophilus bullaregiensis]|uniref:hypothetical protein n=1 Tax=Geodermatophilus bullaregiensis TaxID=1564160 RepID=UPI0019581191|nr:hypothetical protein [Geodermatophilus bullaregiensis]MBM7805807.1 uncharacterized protein with LGFP repeats [Geodermatophilus bullaregiensis]
MRQPRMRTRLATAAGVLALLAVLLAGHLPGQEDRLAEAADLSQFQPGDIISDGLFFDGWAMSEADVQGFLDQKGASCRPGSDGTPCLRVYRQDTQSKPGDDRCAPYAGQPGESAARIIAKVGQACGISQRVLLVMLQKEQSLVTNNGSSLYARRYREAMGFACPDTAACNPAYNGFLNQVYSAARQFKNYAANPRGYAHRAGQVNAVRFHPEAGCGSSSVFILNQATAGLYNYTPYQPNAAALRAGYGAGDDCSAYGNRNFFHYFTDWFGSTHEPGAAAISALYYSSASSWIGTPTQPVRCGLPAGGCHQFFTRGAVYWSPGTGAHAIGGAIMGAWAARGYESGGLGYPVGGELPTADGAGRLQNFQGGGIFWSASTGAWPVRGGIRAAWGAQGADGGPLGYPVGDETPTADGIGVLQLYQGGAVFYSPATGAQPIRGAIRAKWGALGAETGVLGYPITPELPVADGRGVAQLFQGGVISYSPTTGAQPVRGAIRGAWGGAGAETGELGYPVAAEEPGPGGVGTVQRFQRGSVWYTAGTGAHAVSGTLADAWAVRGGVAGGLGWPVTDARRVPGGGGTTQTFQGGALYALTGAETVLVRGAVLTEYLAEAADAGALGLPIGEETTEPTGQVQRFQRGIVHWTASTGAIAVRGGVGGAWTAAGGLTGPLGSPVSRETSAGDGRVQRFTGGEVYWSPATGAHAVRDPLVRGLEEAGGVLGALGFPVAEERTSGDARVQDFQSGTVYATSAGGAHAVRGAIGTTWSGSGGLTGPLGAPTSGETGAGAGRVQRFTGGSVYWSAGTGGQVVSGPVATAHEAAGGAAGPLGLPVGPEAASGSARVQQFQGGGVYWTSAGGAHPVRGAVAAAWQATGGLTGPLGAPVGDETAVGGGVVQAFSGGSVHWSPATRAQVVRGAVAAAYTAAGGPTGPLGFPAGPETASGSGRVQPFQSGGIYWTSAGGAHPVRGAMASYWLATGGIDGPLGGPTGNETAAGPDSAQAFANGVLHWSATSYVHRTTRQILDAYVATGASAGPLGVPVGDVHVRDGLQRVDFARGAIVVRNGVAEVQPA